MSAPGSAWEGPGRPAAGSEGEDLRTERSRLEDYLRDRDAAFRTEHGDTPPDTVAVVGTVAAGRGTPFVTADQQKLIDGITGRYGPDGDFEAMFAELKAARVHPDQLAQSARWFIDHGGVIRDRQGQVVPGAFADVKV